MNQGIRLRWEKPTARGVRYCEVDLHRELWSEWLLIQAWGRRGTRLGQVRAAPCGSHAADLARIAAIGKQQRQRCYVGVADADPPVEKRKRRRSELTDAGAAGQGTAESARGMLGRSA